MANFITIDTTTKPGWFYIQTNLLCPSATLYKELYIEKTDIRGVRLADGGSDSNQFIEVLCNINKSLVLTTNLTSQAGYWPIESFNGVALTDNADLESKIIAQLV